MGAKFHFLTEDYVNNVTSRSVSRTQFNADIQLGSQDLVHYNTDTVPCKNAHVRNSIELCAPTFNYVLARSRADLLRKILGVKSDVWNDIVDCVKVLDLTAGEMVTMDKANGNHKLLYGAQIAEHWIRNMNIEERLIDTLYDCLHEVCSDTVSSREVFEITTTPSEGSRLLFDKYYVNTLELFPSKIKRTLNNLSLDELIELVQHAICKNPSNVASFLLNLHGDVSSLYGMLNYYLIIVPFNLRMKQDNMEHKLTKLYKTVINANYDLNIRLNASHPNDIAVYYKKLDKAISELQYKRQPGPKQPNYGIAKDDLSLLERVKSKRGHIRKSALGKRQDYSGRAVVCINPFLSLDVIRVPRYMLPKLLQYHALPFLAQKIRENEVSIEQGDHMPNSLDNIRLTNLDTEEARAVLMKVIEEMNLTEYIPVLMGRQPTLHLQSIQGFHIEPTDLNAIEVNPCVCPAYNMDFDGDQAWLKVPISEEAVREVLSLALPTQNLFLAKTGACTAEPRMDMIYGLYLCTKDSYVLGAKLHSTLFNSFEDVRKAVIAHQVKVDETVQVEHPKMPILAGDAAVIACFPHGAVTPRGTQPTDRSLPIEQITNKTIGKYMELMLRQDACENFVYRMGSYRDMVDENGNERTERTSFISVLNTLVKTGFEVAKLYPPNLSIVEHDIDYEKTSKETLDELEVYNSAMSVHYDRVDVTDLLYNLGFETAENYSRVFNNSLDKLKKTRLDRLKIKLGASNGYLALSESGARGSMDNLNQAFGLKGSIMKNSNESFDALLPSCYAGQLSPMEHFMDAYGGRQGQIDKSLKTGDTGYAMRRMWHSTQGYTITKLDCETTDGIVISKNDMLQVIPADDNEDKMISEMQAMFAYALTGRFACTKTKEGQFKWRWLSSYDAQLLAEDPEVESVKIRSPLTCACPVCQKCYGIQWGTRKKAVVGTAVGLIAAQSIGEPLVQLVMKVFQKGGIKGSSSVTSAFDKVNTYITMANIAEKSAKGKYSGYDPVAWETGKVNVVPSSDISKKILYINGKKKRRVVVPRELIVKDVVKQGEGFSFYHGDYDVNELMRYCGVTKAATYLMQKLYVLFKNETNVRPIHFELLVASMIRYMIIKTDRSDLLIGQYCTRSELLRGNCNNTVAIPRIVGVDEVINCSCDALDNIIMEDHSVGLSRATLLGMEDTMTKPLNRMAFAQTILSGSAVPTYIQERTVN